MKRIIAIYLLLSPVLFLTAQSLLTVEIVGLESNKGVVIVALLDKQEKDVMDQTSKITDRKCTVVFNDVKNDRYVTSAWKIAEIIRSM